MKNQNQTKWFDRAHQPWDIMRIGLLFPALSLVTHCMAVQVPEDYVSDLYYADQPKVMSLTPSTSMSWTTLRPTIQIKFNNPMDMASVSVDTGGACTGGIQLYDNNNLTCRALTLGTTENRNSVINVTYATDLDPNSDYVITIQGAITDFRAKTLGADATYPFKSGVPSGSEPRVVSVTPSGDWDFIVTFSRQMQVSSIIDLGANNCGSTFVLWNGAPTNYCNDNQNTGVSPAIDATTYTQHIKIPPSGTYTFTVKKGILDRFSIPLAADFTTTVTKP